MPPKNPSEVRENTSGKLCSESPVKSLFEGVKFVQS